MLKKITEGRVESDNGFAIHIIGLEALKYEENNRFIILEWNYDPKIQRICVYASNASSWNQPANVPLTPDEKEKMVDNIREAVKLLKGTFEVV